MSFRNCGCGCRCNLQFDSIRPLAYEHLCDKCVEDWYYNITIGHRNKLTEQMHNELELVLLTIKDRL